MKISYRGVSYDYDPLVVETTVGAASGKYRGRDCRFRNLKKPPVLQQTVNLTYRGVKYSKPGTITAMTVEPEKTPTVSTEQKARSLMVNHTRTIKNLKSN